MDDELLRMRLISNRLTEEAPQAFHRYLFPKIDWENRLVCIKGARGTGKSTILQQHIKETFGLDEHAFYNEGAYVEPEWEDRDTTYRDRILHIIENEQQSEE